MIAPDIIERSDLMFKLELVGDVCREFRKEQGYYQMNVANDLGYSLENISAFENGRNDNLRILLWYIAHGLTFDMIRERMRNNEKV